jgi:hypothetical protein
MARVIRRIVPMLVAASLIALPSVSAQSSDACWGQASAVFAQMGIMGEHASEFPTPRLGLRNLARALHEQGVIEADTMQALGAFVVAELGLDVEACR